MSYLIAFCLIVVLSLLGVFSLYKYYEKKYILNLNELPRICDTIIVLGAGIRPDGEPCDVLKDRLYTASKVYNEGICKNVLLTGDHRDDEYNEVAVMKRWIMKENVREDDITLDGCGFCTYDSMVRAKKNFGINSAIISTNRYHLPRAIYVARRMGIEAYGIASDLRIYDRMKKYRKRERLAQIKDFFLVNFSRKKKK